MKKIDLALQGGGAHGAFTWGVIDRLLDDENIQIDGICGTGAGAMNGVITAYGLQKGGKNLAKHLLVKFWYKVSMTGQWFMLQPTLADTFTNEGNLTFSPFYKVFELITENFSPAQFNPLNYNPLEKILSSLVDFEELQKLRPKKLFVCATNVKTGLPKIFNAEEITVKSILASACLPYLFKPVEINGEYYWDGGYMGNPPLGPLIKNTESTDDILIVQVNSFKIEKIPNSIEEIKDRINEISFNSALMHELKAIKFKNELLDQGITLNGKIKKVYLHNISANEYLKDYNLSSKFNTSWNFLNKLKEKGYKACDEWLKNNYDKIGKEDTIQFPF